MYKEKTFAAVIPAGGIGTRMGTKVPKQYLPISGIPMVVRTIKAFANQSEIDEIIVAVSTEYKEHLTNEICLHLFSNPKEFDLEQGKIKIIEGGKERQDSVRKALEFVTSDYVLIHDGARPFIKEDVIKRNMDAVIEDDAVVTVVPVKDTIRTTSETLKRDGLYAVQTPQTFETGLIKKAHAKALEDQYVGTDDAGLVERLGRNVTMVKGDYENIKITTKEDLPMETRIGTGYDVHQLVEGRKLILGGVEIPYEKGLLGHSDADVLVHALMDAMLGAAALGDIGKHFPDTDEKYKGISSIKLLGFVKELLEKSGYQIVNCDITVIAQEPKLAPYIEQMRENIAKALETDKENVSIKGTTTEKLGFAGRGEGIGAEAVCLLRGRE